MTRLREYSLATLGFTALTVALTYPQIRRMASHVGVHYDALFSIWRLSWVAHQLPRDPWHLFDANIFYPAPNALAYSDAMLFQSLVAAPFLWAGVSPVLVYNGLVLLSFITAGVATYAWLTGVGLSRAGAIVGALAFAFQPYRFAHFPQIELLWTCWMPLAFLALHRVFETRRVRDGVWLGLAVTLQAWSCLYYAVFLVTGLAIVSVVFLIWTRPSGWRKLVLPAIAAVAIAAALCAPYALPYLKNQQARERRNTELANWSASPANYFSTTYESWLYRHPPRAVGPFEGVLFPGFLTMTLAAIGALRSGDRRTLAYAVMAVVAVDLSLGVNGVLYEPLSRVFALYAGLRVPARLFVLVSAALAFLAAQGVLVIVRRLDGVARVLVPAALAAIVLLETASMPLPLNPVPERPRLYRWLAYQPRGAVFEWPAPKTYALGLTRVPDYMYFSIEHWQPLAVGYSGGYARETLLLLERVASFPSPESLQALQRHQVRYLILHSEPDPAGYVDVAKALSNRPEVRFVFADRTLREEHAVYYVVPLPPGSVALSDRD